MKNIFKVSAFLIALTAMLTIVSCQPEVSITGYDFGKANTDKSPESKPNFDYLTVLPSGAGAVSFEYEIRTDRKIENPKVTVTFPASADFHKNINVNDKTGSTNVLKRFLKFYNYSSPSATEVDWRTRGIASVIGSEINYTLDNIEGSSIILVLNQSFDVSLVVPSIVMKIEAAQYTYSSGYKIDRDNNSVGGEKGYDDWHRVISEGSPWNEPTGKNWSVSLDVLTSPLLTSELDDFDSVMYSLWESKDSAKAKKWTFRAGTINVNGITVSAPYTNEAKAACKDVADLVAGGVVLQKTIGDKWVDTPHKASYDASLDDGQNRVVANLLFKDVELEKDAKYRVRWTGSANLVTKSEYFGLKQKVYVSGDHPAGIAANNERRYTYREVISEGSDVVRNLKEAVITEMGISAIKNVSMETGSADGGDVVLKVEFDYQGVYFEHTADPLVGLVEMNTENFKKAFKIVYRRNNRLDSFDDYIKEKEIFNVGITDVKFEKEGEYKNNGGNDVPNDRFFNVIYITLDPSFKYRNSTRNLTFLINDGLKYSSSANYIRQFGDRDNIKYERFQLYSIKFPPITTLLSDNEWKNINITDTNEQDWYEFTATNAAQYIWFMTGTMDYANIYFYDKDLDYLTGYFNYGTSGPTSFSSLPSFTIGHTYYFIVEPYSVGTYRVAFTSTNTAPLLPEPWQSFNFVYDTDEEELSFIATDSKMKLWYLASSTNVYCELYDDSGSYLNYYCVPGSISNSKNYHQTLSNLIVGKKYKIKITSYENSTGPFQIAVTDSTFNSAP